MHRSMISHGALLRRSSGIKRICRNKTAVSMFSLTGEIDTAVVFCEYDIVFWMGKCSPSSVSCTEPRLRLWILLISFSVPAH